MATSVPLNPETGPPQLVHPEQEVAHVAVVLIQRLSTADAAPELAALFGEARQRALDCSDQRRAFAGRQELLDVPAVLGTSGVELEQYEICGSGYRQLDSGHQRSLRSQQDVSLPGATADDEIDIARSFRLEPDHANERIVCVATPDVHPCTLERQLLPEIGLETAWIDGQQVEIDGRAHDAVDGHRRGPDDGVGNPVSFERTVHGRKQIHFGGSSAAQRDGIRPICRSARMRWRAVTRSSRRAAQ
ncbi:MAG: hypothetical protein HY744_00015 [Deltaproteobacteria bacterium]|nr:hypothetical protein [Deltaproteobacteria bacterium]